MSIDTGAVAPFPGSNVSGWPSDDVNAWSVPSGLKDAVPSPPEMSVLGSVRPARHDQRFGDVGSLVNVSETTCVLPSASKTVIDPAAVTSLAALVSAKPIVVASAVLSASVSESEVSAF